jgi:hypothetical protein
MRLTSWRRRGCGTSHSLLASTVSICRYNPQSPTDQHSMNVQCTSTKTTHSRNACSMTYMFFASSSIVHVYDSRLYLLTFPTPTTFCITAVLYVCRAPPLLSLLHFAVRYLAKCPALLFYRCSPSRTSFRCLHIVFHPAVTTVSRRSQHYITISFYITLTWTTSDTKQYNLLDNLNDWPVYLLLSRL